LKFGANIEYILTNERDLPR